MVTLLTIHIHKTFFWILLTQTLVYWFHSFLFLSEEILTRSPDSTKMYVLVLLLTGAFCPPLVGVGWSSRQLSGCSRGSGGGATFVLKRRHMTKVKIQISALSTTSFLWRELQCAQNHKASKSRSVNTMK